VSADDPREELAALVSSLRAHAEWQGLLGATGLPRSEGSPADPRGVKLVTTGPEGSEEPAPLDQIARTSRAVEGLAEYPDRAAPVAGVERPGEAAPAASAEGYAQALTARLELLSEEVKACTRCGLHTGRTQTVFARGTGTSGLCFVGEGPGAEEDLQGLPFVGPAGQLLDRMIDAMGFVRDEVYVCNIVKCRPPKNRKPEAEEMSACLPYLEEQIDLLKPSVIVALGASAVQGLLGVTGGITRLRGEWRLYRGRIPVMPTFHPAYLLRQPSAKRQVWSDLQAVLTHMGRTPPKSAR
jgi:uracil-DNA glycosylase